MRKTLVLTDVQWRQFLHVHRTRMSNVFLSGSNFLLYMQVKNIAQNQIQIRKWMWLKLHGLSTLIMKKQSLIKEMLSITWFCIFILHKIFQCDRILLGPVCSLIAQECVVQKNFCIDWKHYLWTRECRNIDIYSCPINWDKWKLSSEKWNSIHRPV
jgi:hypothetical protein